MTLLRSDAWTKPWYGRFVPTDIEADDNRIIEFGALEHKDLPMPLALQITRGRGHDGSVVVGSIESVAETPNGVYAVGRWLNPELVPEVDRALALVDAGLARPSVDLSKRGVAAQVEEGEGGQEVTRYLRAKMAGATLVSIPAFDDTFIRVVDVEPERFLEGMRAALVSSGFDGSLDPGDGDTFALTGTTSWNTMPVATRDTPYNSDEAYKAILEWAGNDERKAASMFLWRNPSEAMGFKDRYKLPVGTISNGKPVLVYHAIYSASALVSGAHGGLPDVPDADRAKLRGVLSEIYARMGQAFQDPNMRAPWDERAKRGRELVASAAPIAPPVSAFDDPRLPGPTKMTITKNGRVFGHLATWGTCHRGLGQLSGECVKPPRSKVGYAEFHTGQVLTAEGETIDVGRIVMDTTHPIGRYGASLNAAAAAAHYDRTGSCAAIVRAGEDEHGIWVAGMMVPEATEATVAALRRHPLSGDWRRVPGGNLELIAALAVNTPGFPIHQFAADTDGDRLTLVSSAAPGCLDEADPSTMETMSGESTQSDPAPAETTETTPNPEPTSAPTVDPSVIAKMVEDRIAARAAEATAAANRRERLATLATAQWSNRADRLRQLPERA